ncbi:MAG: hypothetical protein WA667_23460 [Candidatus Nitrosopolaris sp.]
MVKINTAKSISSRPSVRYWDNRNSNTQASKRQFIDIENDPQTFGIASARISKEISSC